jgi:hypothetical protein
LGGSRQYDKDDPARFQGHPGSGLPTVQPDFNNRDVGGSP